MTENSNASQSLPPLCLIGGGQMGRAIVGGLIQAGTIRPDDLVVVDPSAQCRQWWSDQHPSAKCHASVQTVETMPPIVLLAVKPPIMQRVAQSAPKQWAGRLLVSVAAGITLNSMQAWFGHDRVIRVMPNTPCLVGEGASAFCAAAGATDEDQGHVKTMLEAVGIAIAVDEKQMNAVTGLSGSGPAYVFTIIEGLADGGVLAGLPRDLAMQLAVQTVLGAATMVKETGQHPGQLKDAVASPAGTTITGLNTLERRAVRAAMADAVAAAKQRGDELG
ncbi:pyrroline-5-carboxylate reductase [Crateriforma conspicua]|uniref:Pyrroline-5-carboxylate reductase n=1 Tax=Crateriforma conspicua TaxID=2527996 RepID=A0A5C5XY52_9PLAN|nr:pyrroline-5-carboxylate reductase [Crateriforma conspicua]TWT68297.1 Pyrroline-5-carboxylate reductase [Crateriforma conspicua]